MQQPEVPRERVRAALDRVLASATFAGSNRSSALLKFLVDAALEGRAQRLKEYTLGTEALGRGAEFDPRVDPIARVEASRLRSRLEVYYATEGSSDDIAIALPKGGYVPQFAPRSVTAGPSERAHDTPAAPVRAIERRVGFGLAAFAILLAAGGTYSWVARPRPAADAQRPLIQVDAALGAPGTLAMLVGSSVAFTPDGERLVFRVLHDDGGTSLFVRPLSELVATEVRGTSGANEFFLSADGRSVAFVADGKLQKTLLDGGGSPIALTDVAGVLGGAWGEDGNIIAPFGRASVLSRLPDEGGTPAPLIDLGVEGVQPRWPQLLPGGRAVLYSAHAGIGATSYIAAARLDDGRSKTLVAPGAHPRYLPSGHLVYLDRGTLFGVAFDAERLEVRGTPVPLLSDVAFVNEFGFGHYDVAPNGTLAYVRSAGNGRSTIERLDADGTSHPWLDEPARYSWPRLSPDGTQLAYTLLDGNDADLWIYDIAKRTKRRLPAGSGGQGYALWTADSRYLLYQEDATPALFARRSDGSGEPRLLVPGVVIPWSITAGGRLAYHGMSNETGFDLWTVALRESPDGLQAAIPELYRGLQTFETYPAFSPDGKFVAYGSNESGAFEIYVRSFPDDGTVVRISTHGGRISTWSKSRPEIFYESNDRQLMTVQYRIENGRFIAEATRPWSTRRLADLGVLANYDLAPDGESVVALLADGAGQSPARDHVTVIVNFLDEVRRRIP